MRPLGTFRHCFHHFDALLAEMSPEEFVANVLVARLGVAAVVVGWDFHFGKTRSGSATTLTELSSRYGFGVDIVAKVEDGAGESARVVSSTAIRRALERGDVAAAALGLGRNYAVSGRVISGQRLGRTLGVPNGEYRPGTDQPARARNLCGGRPDRRRRFSGGSKFWVRPTFDNGPPLLEIHLFDFDGDLYGREMEVEFVERIRGEHKFDSVPSLVAEMERDKERARAILAVRT